MEPWNPNGISALYGSLAMCTLVDAWGPSDSDTDTTASHIPSYVKKQMIIYSRHSFFLLSIAFVYSAMYLLSPRDGRVSFEKTCRSVSWRVWCPIDIALWGEAFPFDDCLNPL